MTAAMRKTPPEAPPRPPGPRGAEAARALARIVAGRPLEACTALAARHGDTVYLPVRPWEGLYILSRPDQAGLCRHYRLDLAGPGLPRPRGFVTLRPAAPVRMRLTRRR